MRKLLERCESVTAVKYLPDILHLLRFLCDNFHSKYSREEARSVTISSILQQISDGSLQDKVKGWVNSYVLALRIALKSVDCEYNIKIRMLYSVIASLESLHQPNCFPELFQLSDGLMEFLHFESLT